MPVDKVRVLRLQQPKVRQFRKLNGPTAVEDASAHLAAAEVGHISDKPYHTIGVDIRAQAHDIQRLALRRLKVVRLLDERIRMATTPSRRSGPAQRSLDLVHGKFRIVAGTHKDMHKAVAYLGPKPVEAIEGESPRAACDTMRDILDDRVATQRNERVEGVPCASEYADAIASFDSDSRENAIDLFLTHARYPGRRARLEEVARRFGNQSEAVGNYLSYCRKLAGLLKFSPRAEDCPRELLPALVAAKIDPAEADSEPVMEMRDELADAIERLWRERPNRAPSSVGKR